MAYILPLSVALHYDGRGSDRCQRHTMNSIYHRLEDDPLSKVENENEWLRRSWTQTSAQSLRIRKRIRQNNEMAFVCHNMTASTSDNELDKWGAEAIVWKITSEVLFPTFARTRIKKKSPRLFRPDLKHRERESQFRFDPVLLQRKWFALKVNAKGANEARIKVRRGQTRDWWQRI